MELLDETTPEAVIPDLNAEAFYQEYTFGDLKVTVSYEAGTVPEGTEVIVTDAKPEAVEAIKAEKGEDISYAGADISFVFDGKEIEPKDFSSNKVKVILEYIGKEDLSDASFETLHVNETLSEDGTIIYGVETVNASMENVTKPVTTYKEVPVYETREITEQRTTMVTKTREVEKTKTVKVKVAFKLFDPSTWLGYKNQTQKYTVTETYEEPVTETVVVGTEEVQVGTETVEDGTEDIVVGQKAVFEADDFSTFVIVGRIVIENEEDSFDFETEEYKITVFNSKDAGIPAGTELVVSEIPYDTDEYWDLWEKSLDKLNENATWGSEIEPGTRQGIAAASFFDISLVCDGQEFEPAVPLQVEILFKNGGLPLFDGQEAKIIHFGEAKTQTRGLLKAAPADGTELINDVQVGEAGALGDGMPDGVTAASFLYEQTGFSDVAVLATNK